MPDRPRWLPAAEILALSALAIAQPLFDLLSRQGAFFVAHRSTPFEIVAFAALVSLGPPVAVLAVLSVRGRISPGLARALGQTATFALIALLLAAPAKRLGLTAPVTLPLVLLAAAFLVVAVGAAASRWPGNTRFVAGVLAILCLAIPLRFLLFSPVAKLVRRSPVKLPEVEVTEPVPVVMLILDANHGIDAQLFPHFAELARQSHWFRNATSVSPLTDFAVPALLTGTRPRDVAPIAAEYPASLFTLLAGSHRLEVLETQTRLCPLELCGGELAEPPAGSSTATGLRATLVDAAVVYLHVVTPEPLDSRLPSISTAWSGFLESDGPGPGSEAAGAVRASGDEPIKYHIWAADRSRDFDRFLDRLQPIGATWSEATPVLYFFHAMLPHVPWVYLPSGKEYWGSLYSSAHAPGVAADTTWTTEAWLVEQAWQRHLAQVAYVDSLLGRLLERLDETGLSERAVVIVVSDHGFAFQPGQPGRHPTRANYAEIMPVPLFVRLPGQATGSLSDRNVETIDVLPTIVDLLGIESSVRFDGETVFSNGPDRPTKAIAATPAETLTFADVDLDRMDGSVARKLEIFRAGLFSLGPHPSLLGRHTADLPTGEPAGIEVRLDQAEHYRNVDPTGPFLPAQIFGRLRGAESTRGDLTLAVAVNGVVRAVTRAFDERGSQRFVALVPEASFQAGTNTVDVFVVDEREAEGGDAEDAPLALRPTVASSAPRYSLELDTDGRAARLLADDGSTCGLEGTAVRGAFVREGTGLLGWAVDPSGARPNVIIMVFADGRAVYTSSTGPRPSHHFDLPEDAAYETAGFQFTLPGALLEATRDLRIFAVLGPTGSELHPLQ